MSELDSMPQAAQQVIKDLQAQLLRQELTDPPFLRSEGGELSPDQMQLIFAEASVGFGEVAREADLPGTQKTDLVPKDNRPRSSNPGRAAFAVYLERHAFILTVPEDQCYCARYGDPVRSSATRCAHLTLTWMPQAKE